MVKIEQTGKFDQSLEQDKTYMARSLELDTVNVLVRNTLVLDLLASESLRINDDETTICVQEHVPCLLKSTKDAFFLNQQRDFIVKLGIQRTCIAYLLGVIEEPSNKAIQANCLFLMIGIVFRPEHHFGICWKPDNKTRQEPLDLHYVCFSSAKVHCYLGQVPAITSVQI